MIEKTHWTLDKKVSIPHLFTTGALILTFVVFLMRMEQNIALNEQRIANLEDDQTEIAQEIKEGFSQVRQDLRRMEDKIDGKADK